MRVPQIGHVDDELWVHALEQVVSMVVLVHIAKDICRLLEEQVPHICGLRPEDLRLHDELLPGDHVGLAHLDGFLVVQADVALGLPLALILVKAVKVSRRVVEKDRAGRQSGEHVRRLESLNVLQKCALLVAVDDVQVLLTDGAEVDEELHAHAACEKRFIRRLAHLEEQLNPVVLALPRQHIRVTLDDEDVDEVEALLVVLGIRAALQVKQVVADCHSVASVDLRRPLQLQSRQYLAKTNIIGHTES